MTTIYDMDEGYEITTGLQSSVVCDEAIHVARWIARDTGRSVIVEDGGSRECYRVTPRGTVRRPPTGWSAEWDDLKF